MDEISKFLILESIHSGADNLVKIGRLRPAIQVSSSLKLTSTGIPSTDEIYGVGINGSELTPNRNPPDAGFVGLVDGSFQPLEGLVDVSYTDERWMLLH